MKTVREWLFTLPQRVAVKAIASVMADDGSVRYNTLDIKTETLASALACAFNWGDSHDGLEYWGSIHKIAEMETYESPTRKLVQLGKYQLN